MSVEMVRRGQFGDMFWRLQSKNGLDLGCETKGNQGCQRVNQSNWEDGSAVHRAGRGGGNRLERRGIIVFIGCSESFTLRFCLDLGNL